MTHTGQMLQAAPLPSLFDQDQLARCIDACFDCAQACTTCADACLGEESVAKLVRCIAVNDVCADVCATTGRALSRKTAKQEPLLGTLITACAEACKSCAEECERHADMHDHCRVCAEACRECEQRCRELIAA